MNCPTCGRELDATFQPASTSCLVAEVVAQVAHKHGLAPKDILSASRTAPIVRARHECWRRLRERGWSYPAIARAFDRDHTTVLAGVRKVRAPEREGAG